MNREKMEQGIRALLEGLLEGRPDPRGELGEWLKDTPARVARSWVEDLAAGYDDDPQSLLEAIRVEGAAGPVILRNVRFTSLCAHHLLPFRGEVSVGFIPRESHVGLGGIARLVDSLARRLCLQETLTADIADHLQRALDPRSLAVVIEAEHLCLAVRGARKTGHRFRTVERRGEPHPDLQQLA